VKGIGSMSLTRLRFLGLLLFTLLTLKAPASELDHLSLSGRWRFELDRANVGVREKWFGRKLTGELNLPGSLPAQGIGDDISVETKWTGDIVDKSWFTGPQYAKYRQPGNVKVPFWLQPEKYYAGVAWYQRDVEIPDKWESKRVELSLERPHWETRVWFDEKPLGSNDSLSTAHEYDLGRDLTPGRHRLTIRVDNGLVVDVGVNSHSISDHTQGNWNGVVGRLELRATPLICLEDVRLDPAGSDGKFRAVATIANATGTNGEGKLSIWYDSPGLQRASPRSQLLAEAPVHWATTGAVVECRCTLPDGPGGSWDEFTPKLHPLRFELSTGDVKALKFGSREISTQGTQFLINGHKTFIRGTLDCCIFP
jgi:hypothetical protein